jgi:hypothetical protein
MGLSEARHRLREQFFTALLDACFRLKQGPDQELSLEVLIEATEMLKEHLEQELAELRQEQAE